MASLPLSIKVFLCLLVVAVSKGEELEESGQYSPELYEKPYETTEAVEEVTTEVAETEPPEVSEEPQEDPEVLQSADYIPASGGPGAPPSVPAIPYPLLYSQYPAPLIYSAPQYLRIAAGFPTVIV